MFEEVQAPSESLTPRQKADLFRKVIELLAPDLQSFYPTIIKGRIEKVYTTNNSHFYCDVQPLNNDESVNEDKALITHVEMPILYAGEDRGIVCQPVVGLLCDITYYGGDENYPAISNIRYTNNKTPTGVQPGELLIQKGPGNFTKFKNDGSRETMIPGHAIKRVGKHKDIKIGGNFDCQVNKDRTDVTHGKQSITSHQDLTIESNESTTVKAKSFEFTSQGKTEIDAGGELAAGGAIVNLASEDTFTVIAAGPINQISVGAHTQNAPNFKQQLTNAAIPPVVDTYDLDILLGNHKTSLTAGDMETSLTLGNHKTSLTAGNMETNLDLGDHKTTLIAGNHETTITTGNQTSSLTTGNYEIDIDTGNHTTTIATGDCSISINAGDYSIDINNSGKFHFAVSGLTLKKIAEDIHMRLDEICSQIDLLSQALQVLQVPTGVGPSGVPTNAADFLSVQTEIGTIQGQVGTDKNTLSDFFK